MKNILYILIACTLFSCGDDVGSSNDSTSTNSEATGKGGSLARFSLAGDYLYTVDSGDLKVFSVINPELPVLVNTLNVGFNIETLFNSGKYLFIGSEFGMYIYNITKPEIPVYESEAQHFRSCDPVVANTTTAFVTLYAQSNCGGGLNELQVYDIQDIKSPILISNRQLIQPKGLGLFGNYLLVCDDIIKIFDVSDTQNIKLVHSIDKSTFDVIIDGTRLYAIGNEQILQYSLNPYDITDIKPLSELSF